MSTAWEPVIGLEIHVQLATRAKMFCGCELSFGDPPNTHTCPVCLAHPGALRWPTAGDAARRLAGLALGCSVPPASGLHRKNYFYPDLSKAYQISQYDEPLCVGGSFAPWRRTGAIWRSASRGSAPRGGRGQARPPGRGRPPRRGRVLEGVDFSRGGTPLLEIVTEPDLRSAADAGAFLRRCARPCGASA